MAIDVPSKLLYKRQSFPIGCYSKPLRVGAVISSLSLYKVIDNTVHLLVGAKYDNVTMRTTTIWRDRDFKNRAELVTANINPMKDATLSIQISTDKVRCWDASTYRCELALGGKKFSVQQNTVTVLCKHDNTNLNLYIVYDTTVKMSRYGDHTDFYSIYFCYLLRFVLLRV